LDHADRAEQVGDEQAVDHEPGAVGHVDDGLAEGAGEQGRGAGAGGVVGAERADQFDERHDGDGAEEVDADDALGVAGGAREAADGEGGGGRGEDGVRVLEDAVDPGEQGGLEVRALGDGLDDEVAVGERVEVGGHLDAGEGGVEVGVGEPALPDALAEGAADAVVGGRYGAGAGDDDADVEAGPCGDVGDAGAHAAAADDADPGGGFHGHVCSCQRIRVAPIDMPPPNPASSTRSPSARAPERRAASRATGTEALPMLPYFSRVRWVWTWDSPARSTRRRSSTPLGWCGTRWSTRSAGTPLRRSRRCRAGGTWSMTKSRTPRPSMRKKWPPSSRSCGVRGRRLPPASTRMRPCASPLLDSSVPRKPWPSRTGPTTAAPAPSPRRTAVRWSP